ncbi:MAG: aldehyde dehydrogenase family protein, partial [Anaerolineae bacterium]
MAVTKLPEEVTLQPETTAFLSSGPKKLLIGGEWVSAASGETFETVNPATSEVLMEAAAAGEADVDAAAHAAREAFISGPWSQMNGYQRADLLWRLAELIDQHADELAELETLDNGKPLKISRRVDIPQAAKHLKYYAGWANKIEGSTIPVSFPNNLVYTVREPVGVVGAIIPWNFPLLMATWKLAPALAAGYTVILKPAEQTPLTDLRMGELIAEAGFPPGVIDILTGFGVPAGSAITAHMGIDKVAFSGSTAVGRRIMEAAATSNLKRVSLELGGKSPNFIFADADMAGAVRGANWAIFS